MQRKNIVEEDYFDLNSFSKKKPVNKKSRRKRKSVKKTVLSILCIVLVLILCIGIGGWVYINSILNHKTYEPVDESKIQITSEAKEKFADYTNIALYGLDSREDDDEGRSDAIMVLSLDNVHNKIKMVSIARDTLVKIQGHSDQKITHAWMYGKATTALDTLNRNFDLNITDYVSMNFYQFSSVIDYIGGVWIDVDKSEKNVMNTYYIPYLQKMGIKCEKVTQTGYQLLNGGQALAYSRNRYTGSDLERGSRQREVLMAMYDKIQDIEITKLPKLASMVLDQCQTSLTNGQLMSMATWALTNKPEFEQLGLPNDTNNAQGKIINTYWVWVYDLDVASKQIHDFILETGDYIDPKTQSEYSAVSSQ